MSRKVQVSRAFGCSVSAEPKEKVSEDYEKKWDLLSKRVREVHTDEEHDTGVKKLCVVDDSKDGSGERTRNISFSKCTFVVSKDFNC